MAQLILDQVIDNSPAVLWDDIAGQENAKQALQENVVWPALRPEVCALIYFHGHIEAVDSVCCMKSICSGLRCVHF